MSGASAVIIGDDENKSERTMDPGKTHLVDVGDTLKNPAWTGATAYIIFTRNNMVTTDVYLAPQQTYAIPAAGSAVLQP